MPDHDFTIYGFTIHDLREGLICFVQNAKLNTNRE